MAARIHSFSRAHRPLLTPASSVVASRARSRAASGYHRLPTPKRALVPHAASVRGESGQRSSGVAPAQPRLAVLIPAYQPDERLPQLVATLRRDLGCAVLVVDDGSGAEWDAVFAECGRYGADVQRYSGNRGKGYALRVGLARAMAVYPAADVVCADADGQHTPGDIAAVARRVRESGAVTLGVREFVGAVPLRSRVGNDVTAALFAGATGWRLRDTQTGLRGYPAGAYAWMLGVAGDRYEYELSALLLAADMGVTVETVGIETVYEEGNTSSHFRPIQDSARIYAPLLRYMGTRGLRQARKLLRGHGLKRAHDHKEGQ